MVQRPHVAVLRPASPRSFTLRVLLVGVIAAVFVLFRALPGQAVEALPGTVITATPNTALPGDTIILSGVGFAAVRPGQVLWVGQSEGMPEFTTGWNGAFRVEVIVPELPAETYTVSIEIDGTTVSTAVAIPEDGQTRLGEAREETNAQRRPASSSRRVVAYFPLWLRNSGYTERDIDFTAVTQVAHFSVDPRADGSVLIPDWGLFPDPALVRYVHDNGAKIVLVVGGDQAAATRGFSGLASSPGTRATFIRNIMQLVTSSGYDGIDLDWEFPESEADRANLTALVQELRAALGPDRSLSIAGPSSDWYGRWYDIPALMPYLDWFGAMTYDIHGPGWSGHAGHNAPLYANGQADTPHWGGEITVDSSRAYYLGRGVPAAKLLLGLPFFGKRFDGASDMYQSLSNTNGEAVAYKDIVPQIGNWTQKRDDTASVPYLTGKDGGVITFDDAASIVAKCNYIAQQNVGGAIVWHLGQDGSGANQPLLQAVRECR